MGSLSKTCKYRPNYYRSSKCRCHRPQRSRASSTPRWARKRQAILKHSVSLFLARYPGQNLTKPFVRPWMLPTWVRTIPVVDGPTNTLLVQLHNSLIISLFDFTVHRRPPTPPPDVSKPPPRKRRRTLPYQGPDDTDDTLRSSRLKRWTVSLGRRERERIRGLQNIPTERPRPRKETDEIARDRGVVLLDEHGGTRHHSTHFDYH